VHLRQILLIRLATCNMQRTTCNNYVTVATGNVAAVKDRPERRTARSAARPTTRLSRRTCHSEVSTRVAYTVSTARFSSVYSQACAALRCRLPLACNARRTAPLNRRQLCLFVSSSALESESPAAHACFAAVRLYRQRPNVACAAEQCTSAHGVLHVAHIGIYATGLLLQSSRTTTAARGS
jgi:hypothetical protein